MGGAVEHTVTERATDAPAPVTLSAEAETIAATAWSIEPVDEPEREAAFTVDVNEVNMRAPEFAYGIDQCGSCSCDLSQCGLAVDGRMKMATSVGQLLHALRLARLLRNRMGHGTCYTRYNRQGNGDLWRGFEEQPTSFGIARGG
jgi:hypothetical protein